jgi:hypothetical protein
MQAAMKLRKLISVLVTGVFFLVAAIGVLNGATTLDALVRAGITSLVVTGLAIAFLRTVEDALTRATDEKSGGYSAAARRDAIAKANNPGDS